MEFILLIDNQKKWTLNVNLFEEFLYSKYKHFSGKVISDTNRPYSYEWSLKNKSIEGFIHKDGDSIHFEGDFFECFDFAIALRKIIPRTERVLFFDSSYNYNTIIESNTTREDLIKIFNS